MSVKIESRGVVQPHSFMIVPLEQLTRSSVPGFGKTTAKVLASSKAGANFTQSLIAIEATGCTVAPIEEPGECIMYGVEGTASLRVEDQERELTLGSYVYIPPKTKYTITNEATTAFRFLKLERTRPQGLPAPHLIHGNAKEVQDIAGRRGQSAKSLLSRNIVPFIDFLFNIFTAQPKGGTAFVEMHVEEHGLLFTTGEGTYTFHGHGRYPVKAGDYVWVGPFTPHIFTNTGREPCRYIFYKG